MYIPLITRVQTNKNPEIHKNNGYSHCRWSIESRADQNKKKKQKSDHPKMLLLIGQIITK